MIYIFLYFFQLGPSAVVEQSTSTSLDAGKQGTSCILYANG